MFITCSNSRKVYVISMEYFHNVFKLRMQKKKTKNKQEEESWALVSCTMSTWEPTCLGDWHNIKTFSEVRRDLMNSVYGLKMTYNISHGRYHFKVCEIMSSPKISVRNFKASHRDAAQYCISNKRNTLFVMFFRRCHLVYLKSHYVILIKSRIKLK
jgi:hypothetical protein